MNAETLREAYDVTDYGFVRPNSNLEIPVATPAVFAFGDALEQQADDVRTRIDGPEYALIDAYTQDGSNGGIHVSAKVYDSETNQFLKVKVGSGSVRIFPDSEELSFETFRWFVEHVGDRLDTGLELEEGETDG